MEVLYEIYLSIRQNKIRTFLSGFGISWGILILVVLLGTGKGFQNSVMDIFSIFAQKSMYVYGGATSMKYKNIREGEQLHFDLHFLNRIKKQFPGIKAISPEITGPYSQVMNKAKSGLFKIIGINENYMGIKMDDILIKEMTRIPVMLPLSAKMSVRPYLIIKKRWVSRSTLPILILR